MTEPVRAAELRLGEMLGGPPEHTTAQGLAPRGLYPPGEGVAHDFQVLERSLVWSEGIERLYEQAKERQWDASRDIPWEQGRGVQEPLERALCTVLTWMVQQEFAAWYVPAKFVPRIHPAYLEPVLFLSTQVVDEARHVEVFTKRLFLNGVGFVGAYPKTEASLQGLIARRSSTRPRSYCTCWAREPSSTSSPSSSASCPTKPRGRSSSAPMRTRPAMWPTGPDAYADSFSETRGRSTGS